MCMYVCMCGLDMFGCLLKWLWLLCFQMLKIILLVIPVVVVLLFIALWALVSAGGELMCVYLLYL